MVRRPCFSGVPNLQITILPSEAPPRGVWYIADRWRWGAVTEIAIASRAQTRRLVGASQPYLRRYPQASTICQRPEEGLLAMLPFHEWGTRSQLWSINRVLAHHFDVPCPAPHIGTVFSAGPGSSNCNFQDTAHASTFDCARTRCNNVPNPQAG